MIIPGMIFFVSIPVQLALLFLLAQKPGGSATDYLGLKVPRRGELMVGVAATVALIVVGNALSWLLGRFIVTSFQLDIYRTAEAAGWLPLLWLAVVVVTPIGEESLFRGFLFRGWLRAPRDTWPVISPAGMPNRRWECRKAISCQKSRDAWEWRPQLPPRRHCLYGLRQTCTRPPGYSPGQPRALSCPSHA